MKIYIYAEAEELEAIAEPLAADIAAWMPEDNPRLTMVNQPADPDSDQQAKLGLTLVTKKKKALVKPVEFLYGLAKTYKCEFVVGILDEASGEAEDICYFGYEEGRPDVNEMANYLDL